MSKASCNLMQQWLSGFPSNLNKNRGHSDGAVKSGDLAKASKPAPPSPQAAATRRSLLGGLITDHKANSLAGLKAVSFQNSAGDSGPSTLSTPDASSCPSSSPLSSTSGSEDWAPSGSDVSNTGSEHSNGSNKSAQQAQQARPVKPIPGVKVKGRNNAATKVANPAVSREVVPKAKVVTNKTKVQTESVKTKSAATPSIELLALTAFGDKSHRDQEATVLKGTERNVNRHASNREPHNSVQQPAATSDLPVVLSSAVSSNRAREKLVLVELPEGIDLDGDAGVVGRVCIKPGSAGSAAVAVMQLPCSNKADLPYDDDSEDEGDGWSQPVDDPSQELIQYNTTRNVPTGQALCLDLKGQLLSLETLALAGTALIVKVTNGKRDCARCEVVNLFDQYVGTTAACSSEVEGDDVMAYDMDDDEVYRVQESHDDVDANAKNGKKPALKSSKKTPRARQTNSSTNGKHKAKPRKATTAGKTGIKAVMSVEGGVQGALAILQQRDTSNKPGKKPKHR